MTSETEPIGQDPEGAEITVFRRYLFFRIGSLIFAALALVAAALIFALKNSPVGLIGSFAAFVAFFIAFAIVQRKRRAWFRRLLELKGIDSKSWSLRARHQRSK